MKSSKHVFLYSGLGHTSAELAIKLFYTYDYAKDFLIHLDKYFLDYYEFSLLECFEKNPKSLTIKIKQNLITDLGYSHLSENVFINIHNKFPYVELTHENGVCNLFCFKNIASIICNKLLSNIYKKENNINDIDVYYCGYSLGEISAICCMMDENFTYKLISTVLLLDSIFIMNNYLISVDEWGVFVLNLPFIEKNKLMKIISIISTSSQKVLSISGFNVTSQSFNVTGSLSAHKILQMVIKYIVENDFEENVIYELIYEYCNDHSFYDIDENYQFYKRIPNINVPVHSEYLINTIDSRNPIRKIFLSLDDLNIDKYRFKIISTVLGTAIDFNFETLKLMQRKVQISSDVNYLIDNENNIKLDDTFLSHIFIETFVEILYNILKYPTHWTDCVRFINTQIQPSKLVTFGVSNHLSHWIEHEIGSDICSKYIFEHCDIKIP